MENPSNATRVVRLSSSGSCALGQEQDKTLRQWFLCSSANLRDLVRHRPDSRLNFLQVVTVPNEDGLARLILKVNRHSREVSRLGFYRLGNQLPGLSPTNYVARDRSSLDLPALVWYAPSWWRLSFVVVVGVSSRPLQLEIPLFLIHFRHYFPTKARLNSRTSAWSSPVGKTWVSE